ncbi:hypothetical protein KY290_021408 [Solanum tuberosum]|uniref:Reverse transcriptase n=1 Tax=Solanum tuberosum TaxID=4113 RepID=A0ABQ7V4K7_SOLTU|nr:hypothetical protein KY290_021408 [Solanum tuberosum]
MINKYCKKLHHVVAQCRGASLIRKKLVFVRELIEHQIWWKIEKGDASFWYDNWTTMGLYITSFLKQERKKLKVPVDEVVQSMGINLVSRCISLEGLQLSQVVIKWWTSDSCRILKPLMRAVPTAVIWNLWKRRNSLKHGRPSSYNNLVFRVNSDLWKLGRTIYPKLQDFPTKWSDIVACREKHKPKLYDLPVCWKSPEGDLVYAQGEEIQEGTNLEVDAVAIRDDLAHCVTKGVMKACLETDSEVLIKILTRIWEVPWSIVVIIKIFGDSLKNVMFRSNMFTEKEIL